MSTKFALNQSNLDGIQSAALFVPGCGRKDIEGGPVVSISFEDNKPVMRVYADINSEDWTHQIDLTNALETSREPEKKPARKSKTKRSMADEFLANQTPTATMSLGKQDEPADKSE